MDRFKKGDRVRFKQGNNPDWNEGTIDDEPISVDHNPAYPIRTPNKELQYVLDVAPNEIRRA